MKLQEQIKSYWNRISKIEERIQLLAEKGIDYSIETKKRKEMLRNVKYLDKKK